MSAPLRMMRDILDQPESLTRVLDYQLREGRPSLEKAAEALRGARRVIVTGMGASLFAAMPMSYALNAQVIEAGELLHFAGALAADAVVILVSRSGETVEAVRVLPLLREAGALVIGVTNEPGTTLAREADIPILVNSGRDEAVAVQTYTGTVMATLLLAAAVAGDDRREEALAAIEAVRQTTDGGAEFLDGARVVYVLGRGPSLASAHEGALLFNETAKLPSVGMPCGGFRHGPVEVVDQDFRAFVFASQAQTRDLDLALASYIEAKGGKVRLIQAEPGFFTPAVEIIPLQYAAYHAAEARDFVPGKFRYVSLVTTSETNFDRH